MRSLTGTSYTLGSPTRRCAATGAELSTGEEFVAALAQSLETEEFVRLDYSPDAWSAGARPTPPLLLLGFWRGRVPEPGAKPRMLLDDASLLDLFEQTLETLEREPNPQRGAFAYVLALILVRKRLLIIESSRPGSMTVRAKGAPRPGEPGHSDSLVEIREPDMDEESIALAAEALKAVLSDSAPSQPAAGAVAT